MLTLYHNALSTCSQKVRLVFAEKRLEFESRPIDLVAGEQHAPEYVALNPKHVVPTLVVDGEVVRESSIIAEYLDACVAKNPLTPEVPLQTAKMRIERRVASFTQSERAQLDAAIEAQRSHFLSDGSQPEAEEL